ncbi:MAG: glycosyl hydrolase [Acidobacteria bacterium]|nr:MAG: glycosyl hydrolase [Acidobacteriota bacterium]
MRKQKSSGVRIFIGTKKGAFILSSDPLRKKWKLSDPILLGNMVHHIMLDPRDGKMILMAARTGHLGPTVFRSTDHGRTWKEAQKPVAFKKAKEGEKGLTVDHVFWLTPGHASEPGVWYAGTSPQGLFRSEDHGNSWEGVSGFNEHSMRRSWTGGEQDGTPDGPKMHSILIDPRDPNHLYIGMSSGGVFESTNKGADFKPLNQGCAADFIPTPDPEYGHDPHCVRLHPLRPDRLYQQNHCGIYRMEREEGKWIRIGNNMPKKIGDIGFPLVVHPHDPESVWVFPMDGTTVWPRTSPQGKPAAYRTFNAGKTWKRLNKGLPKENAWWTVKRQAMTVDHHSEVGVYFGTTSGEVWGSRDEGESWHCLVRNLPHIYSLEAAVTQK